MSPDIVNEDGSRVIVEAVFYKRSVIYATSFDTPDEARRMLNSGEDFEDLSPVGVFIDGEPRTWRCADEPPTAKQAEEMRRDYHAALDTEVSS